MKEIGTAPPGVPGRMQRDKSDFFPVNQNLHEKLMDHILRSNHPILFGMDRLMIFFHVRIIYYSRTKGPDDALGWRPLSTWEAITSSGKKLLVTKSY